MYGTTGTVKYYIRIFVLTRAQVWFQNRRAAFKKKRKLSAMVQLRAGAGHSQMSAQQSAQLSQQLAFFGAAAAAGGAMPMVSAAAGMGVEVGAGGQSGQPNETQLLYQMSRYKSAGVPLAPHGAASPDFGGVGVAQKTSSGLPGGGGGVGTNFGMGMGMAAAWPHLMLAPSMEGPQISSGGGSAAGTGAQSQALSKADRTNTNNSGGSINNNVQQEYMRSQSYMGALAAGDQQNPYSIAASDASAAHRRPPQPQRQSSPPTLLSLVAPQNDSPHSRRAGLQLAPHVNPYADTGAYKIIDFKYCV